MNATDTDQSRFGRIVWALLLTAGMTGCPISDLQQGTDAATDAGGMGGGSDGGSDGATAGSDATTADGAPTGDGASAHDGAPVSPDASDAAPPGMDGSLADDGGYGPDSSPFDGGDDGPAVDTVYYGLDDTTRWTFFSASAVANGVTKYSGVAFDGRYLYFVPQFSPPNVLRYDTQGGFTDPTAWTYYAPLPAIVAAGGLSTGSYTYLGGAFDGRYLYLAPYSTNAYAIRYDTQEPFSQDASWSAFNAVGLDTMANYWGVVSDGRYAYFIPNKTSKVLIYDNTLGSDAGPDFTSPASFTTYDLGTGNTGYWGGVFDGTYVYLVPYSGSIAVRHDTILPITTGWDVGATNGFDFNNNFVLGSAAHFWGGAFDGSHVYMIPDLTQSWTLAAYATSGQFSDYGSWTTCALGTELFGGNTSGQGFVGAAFDGKRLFLAPYGTPVGDSGAPALPIVAFDTTQPLCPSNLATAYTTFNASAADGGAGAAGFEGAAFDGQYVYFVPHTGSVVARFQAKSANGGLAATYKGGSWW